MNLSVKNTARRILQSNDRLWESLINRDPSADGKFFYSVKTTGIYCRPSCPARLARRENVRFHASREAAERAGFRPCKRCKPNQPSLAEQHAKAVTKVCRLIENCETMPTLEALARHAALSPYHFHRLFKFITGLTPKGYAAAHRAARVRHALGKSRTVTEAIYGAGYNSSGRFYEQSNRMLGMTPSQFRTGGAASEIRFAVGECSLGSVLVAASARGVCAILLGDEPQALVRDLQDRFPNAKLIGGDSQFEQMIARVVGFVDAPGRGLDLPLDIRGTAFQQRVWQALREIKPGSTATYSEIARRIGSPHAVRAVARACAANALAVVIPCHRVVRTDGSLSGYRWGVERKRTLLAKEGSLDSQLIVGQNRTVSRKGFAKDGSA